MVTPQSSTSCNRRRRVRRPAAALLCGFFLTGLAGEVAADASLPTFESQRTCSASETYCVETDLRRRETRVYENGALRWSVPEISCELAKQS